MKSLQTKLSLWYLGSLLILAGFFYLFVHILNLPNSTEYFIGLILILALTGFIVIHKITDSLTYFAKKMRQITSKNLNERVRNFGDGEIGELSLAFNELLNRLDEAFKREQQFIGDVAHELKTPLSTMKTSLEIALNKNRTNDQYRKTIEHTIKETDRLSGTVKNVLDLAWSESQSSSGKPIVFNLTELLEEISDIASKLATSKGVTIKSTIDKNIEISGFKEKLARAILNIVDNAIKYTPPTGKVEISLEKVNNQALIIVKDNGQGIAKEEIPHIFDRFYRGAKTEKVFGSGLGLAISKSIVQLHKGNIKVKSQVNHGTTFAIIIPLPQTS